MIRDIAQYFQASGVGTIGTDIFLHNLPASPDNVIAIYQYAGEPPDLHWNGEYPGLQVLVRNKVAEMALTKIEQIKNILHGVCETTINGHKYLLIQARQSPELLERDSNNRAIFVCNFKVIKEVD